MFMWVKLLAGVVDADEILDDMKEAKVVVVPGKCPGFRLQSPQRHRWAFVRSKGTPAGQNGINKVHNVTWAADCCWSDCKGHARAGTLLLLAVASSLPS